jgi:hypothetical protein
MDQAVAGFIGAALGVVVAFWSVVGVKAGAEALSFAWWLPTTPAITALVATKRKITRPMKKIRP